MTPNQRKTLISKLTPIQVQMLAHEWLLWARPKQLPPPLPWRVWLLMAGRGFGKTRAGAEWVRMVAKKKCAGRIALVGETEDDTRHVMVEGASGILSISPLYERPQWLPSRRLLLWPNGVVGRCFSASDPEQLRGPEHQYAWADEVAKWQSEESWHNLMLGLRIGHAPRVVATTTPRPKKWLMNLIKEEGVIVTTGATHENSENLAAEFLTAVENRYRNTHLGRQELDGCLVEENPDALWKREAIEMIKRPTPERRELVQVVIGVDPAVGGADETGIIVAGKEASGVCWVLEDLSLRAAPTVWASRILQASKRWQANRLVVEVNQGGNLIKDVLHTKGIRLPIRAVHARKTKTARAEPIASAYAEGKVLHAGDFDQLEDQMCSANPGTKRSAAGSSPDRLDAMVWALTDLIWGKDVSTRTFSF